MAEENKTLGGKIRQWWRILTFMNNEIDTSAAEARIREGIYFRGTNVWILACSVIIASVGLNVNSIPVIIGAMLISPLMGPIIGMGLSLGVNDSGLLLDALRNFIVMVVISLLFSTVYFVITPLDLANPTELQARTGPTIFDVFIAFFGGVAGMIENCRKEQGTVISGVAIATALMPPLCTAGYGLANANWRFFSGALLLFVINTVFILLATYITAGALKFDKKYEINPQRKRFRAVSGVLVAIVLAASLVSAVVMIRNNRIESGIQGFIDENKTFGSAYIYDYRIVNGKEKTAEIFFAGDLTEDEISVLRASAARHGLDPDKMEIKANAFGEKTGDILTNIYERADAELAAKDVRIRELEEELAAEKGAAIPYVQITRELKYKYPQVQELSLSRGLSVQADSLNGTPCTNALVYTGNALQGGEIGEIQDWLRLRMNDSTVVVRNLVE